jgi:hypothetical protein
MAKFLFEEMRYCFAYGQFIATVVLGTAYIVRTLAAKFFAAGRTELEREGIGALIREARKRNVLTENEAKEIDRIRLSRNPVAHFRRPGADDSIQTRSLQGSKHEYEILEREARAVIRAAIKVLGKRLI